MIGRDGSRDQVIAKYRAYIVQQPALMAQTGRAVSPHKMWRATLRIRLS